MRVGWLLLVALPAQAAKELTIQFVVTDADGKPVPDAVIVFPIEGQRHRVNIADGTYTVAHLYPNDGSERALVKGDELPFVAAAPGYAPTPVEYYVTKKPTTVVLKPIPTPALPCVPPEVPLIPQNGAAITKWADEQLALPGPREAEAAWCLLGARSYGALLDWQAKSHAYIDKPDDEARAAEESAQRRTYETSRDWLEWAATSSTDLLVAGILCQVSSPRLEPCD